MHHSCRLKFPCVVILSSPLSSSFSFLRAHTGHFRLKVVFSCMHLKKAKLSAGPGLTLTFSSLLCTSCARWTIEPASATICANCSESQKNAKTSRSCICWEHGINSNKKWLTSHLHLHYPVCVNSPEVYLGMNSVFLHVEVVLYEFVSTLSVWRNNVPISSQAANAPAWQISLP